MILTWSLLKSRKFDSDDNIDVGAELYEIDTEAEASTSAPEASSEKPAAAVAAAPASVPEPAKPPVVAAAVPEKKQQSHRTPLIHFLGKDGWKNALTLSAPVNNAPIPANYGRPIFTEEEMEALVMGGANLVPEVKQHSNGAVFGW
jgi:pyruvate/2-oxoglutarate dehydrogenase complex dihydrolipoamide acyltransferase (E2) component